VWREDCSILRTRFRKTPVSELFTGHGGIGVSRAKTAASGVSDELAVIRQVRWRFAAQQLEDNNGQFEDDPLLQWQPVQADKTVEMSDPNHPKSLLFYVLGLHSYLCTVESSVQICTPLPCR